MIYLSLIEYPTQVFDWYLCRIQYKKNYFFTKQSLIPLSFLCKLYHKTDCHRFDEYKQSHCGITLGPQSNSRYHENIPWAFFQEHGHPLIETSSSGSCNSQEFYLDNLFYFQGVSSYRKPSKGHLKHPL